MVLPTKNPTGAPAVIAGSAPSASVTKLDHTTTIIEPSANTNVAAPAPNDPDEAHRQAAIEENKRIYKETRGSIEKLQLSNSESYDKAILSFSAAGLGLSISFVKEIVPLSQVNNLWLLYCSWLGFVTAIIFVVSSFICSQQGLAKQLKRAERLYLENDETAEKEGNGWATATEILNLLSGFCFITAVIITTVFVSSSTNTAALKARAEAQAQAHQPAKHVHHNGHSATPKKQTQSVQQGE